jgi:hypothetical protein
MSATSLPRPEAEARGEVVFGLNYAALLIIPMDAGAPISVVVHGQALV